MKCRLICNIRMNLDKEEIRIENELEMLEKKEYAQLEKKLKRDLERVRESLQD